MKLSIIIPVYNSEKTINKLIDSILDQKKHTLDLEIIIINDGSIDKTKGILSNIAIKNNNIKVYHTKNQGVYKARNLALQKVTGSYIWMLDADDYISFEALFLIENVISNAVIDILNIGYNLEIKKEEFHVVKTQLLNANIINGVTFLKNNDGRLYLWNNIYNSNFIKTNKFSFLAKSVSLEDFLFNVNVFVKAKKVMCLNKPLYTYGFSANSISRNSNLEHLIKKGTSSYNVQLNTKLLRDTYKENSIEYEVLNEKLNHSVLGFFFSLIIEKYPLDYVNTIYDTYKKEGLLPCEKNNTTLKLWFFQKIVNFKNAYIFICKIKSSI
jgi:glycosyltransferase involved in cell wall biosynthesis